MRKLFSFRGRTSRLGYWRVQLLMLVVLGVALSVGYLGMINVGPAFAVLLAVIPIACAAGVATSLRRLHDRGKSVGWLLLFLVAPPVLLGLADALRSGGGAIGVLAGLPLVLAGLCLTGWGWVEIGFLPGEPRPNRFGPPPQIGAGLS